MRNAISVHPRKGRKSERYVIGLTGPIASGKSTVSGLLVEHGAELIDADRVYQELVEPGSELWLQIVDRFGETIVNKSGEIDRQALGSVVFGNARDLEDLDQITHPAVVAEILRRIEKSTSQVIVIEAIKLFSSGLADYADVIWYIDADEQTRLKRLKSYRGLDETAARHRLSAAMAPIPAGVAPDVSIANNGSLDELKDVVASAWRETVENRMNRRGLTTAKSPKEDS
jgi:dephospho-CoA kinase